MKEKPLIAISCRSLPSTLPLIPQIQGVIDSYIGTIVKAGGIPVPIPLLESTEDALLIFEKCSGLLLCGGEDITPSLYGGATKSHVIGDETITEIMKPCPKRDALEIALIQKAWDVGRPILGICRGSQIINVAFGGTLFQDVEEEIGAKGHFALRYKDDDPDLLDDNTHSVTIQKGTTLYEILQKESIGVNSLHHQAVKDVAEGFVVSALSDDGVIEAIEPKAKDRFTIGVEWHPELLWQRNNPLWLHLFKKFVEASNTQVL